MVDFLGMSDPFYMLFLQNDDEDLVYMYNGYMHKLMMFFLSHPLTRDKVCALIFLCFTLLLRKLGNMV